MTQSEQTSGLSLEEVKKRQLEFGPNEVVPSRVQSLFSEFLKILMDPMGLMLLVLSGLYALIGETTDAIVLFIAVIPVTAVDVVLEVRSRRALRALQATLRPTAKVIRAKTIQEVSTRDLVPGDILVFEEGQSIPADGKLLRAQNLAVNEASLTGESVPVDKDVGSVFLSGTTVLRGHGEGVIESIGRATQYGKVAKLLNETSETESPLQKKVGILVKRILIFTSIVAVLLFFLELSRTGHWLQSLIVAVTFGMAAVPEEFPLVFTLYLSLGAWRLTKHGVLVKSLPSVEALGSVDVICTDKTGTLTEGHFQLSNFISFDASMTDEFIWTRALMACEINVVDAMEAAIRERAKNFVKILKPWDLTQDYPFEPLGKHMSHVWVNSQNQQKVIAMKGAVEGVLEHCFMTGEDRVRVQIATEKLASQGKRLLGLASRDGSFEGNRISDESNLQFLGILVFDDPVRESAKQAITTCQLQGIRVKMLTGDHPLTAHAVADETGIEHSHDLLFSGTQLSQMNQADRWMAYQRGAVFSRVLPEQKYEMVQALQDVGNVVAMTGDGINDAPALKLADIGISMGANATDVARSSAEMILLKNDFMGIAEAVFEGRRIFANLRRSFSYLVSFHIPVILLALTPPAMGWGDLLLPIHIILLELIVHPVSAFAFENLPAEKRQADRSLLPAKRFFEAALSGMLLSLGSLLLFRLHAGTFESSRMIAVITVLLGNVFFVVAESWPLRTKRMWLTCGSLMVLTALVVEVPALSQLFHLGAISWLEVFYALLVGMFASIPSLVMRLRGQK